MSGWQAKRFWSEASVSEADGGYAVALDARSVRTPGEALLVLPTRALAEAVAAEWSAQGEVVDPRSMPVTRAANSALDKVGPQRSAVIAHLVEYGATDLLCYRADSAAALTARQTDRWDPVLDWAAQRFGARLRVGNGLMPMTQDSTALDRLAAQVAQYGPFPLTALHDLVTLSGSLILGLAVADDHLLPETAWALSRLDEDWQQEQWGTDAEAADAAETARQSFLGAARFFILAQE